MKTRNYASNNNKDDLREQEQDLHIALEVTNEFI